MSMNQCPTCGKQYAPHSAMCPVCNYWFASPADYDFDRAPSRFNKAQVAAYAGAILLIVGLFTPLVGVPFFTVNYYNLSQFSSYASLGFFLVLMCGIGAGLLAITGRLSSLRWPGLASLIILAYTFYTISSKITEAKAQVARSMATMNEAPGTSGMAANQFKQMGSAFMSMIQMQWGWGVLVAGAVLLIVASMLKEE